MRYELSSFVMALLRMACLLCALASCQSEPSPWCEWAPKNEAGVSIAAYLSETGWGAAFAPQRVRIVASRRGESGPALDTLIANDGANIDERNLQLARLRSGVLQLQLSGEEQQAACYRFVPRELAWQAAPCSTDVAEPYSYSRRKGS